MKYREIVQRLAAMGCRELPRTGAGFHRKWLNPVTDRVTVLPDWGGANLKLGTIRAVVRQLGLEWEDFKRA